MSKSVDIRAQLVDVFRRDLVGPGPQDPDLANERLNENPSRWYLTGFIAPAEDPLAMEAVAPIEDDPSAQEEGEPTANDPDEEGGAGGLPAMISPLRRPSLVDASCPHPSD